MSRTVSLVDLSERLMRAAGVMAGGYPRISDDLQDMAADALIAAAETGELAMSELAGLSDDRNEDPPEVPATGRPPLRIELPARKAVAS